MKRFIGLDLIVDGGLARTMGLGTDRSKVTVGTGQFLDGAVRRLRRLQRRGVILTVGKVYVRICRLVLVFFLATEKMF